MDKKVKLRDILVDVALQWQASFGIAPSITSSISEYDAAMLVGMSEKEYSDYMRDKTAVAKGTDFVYRNIRYQVKANRPSGKKGKFCNDGSESNELRMGQVNLDIIRQELCNARSVGMECGRL